MKQKAVLILLIYLIFRIYFTPLGHTGDGWGYACEILKHDYFSPHHIIYKPFTAFITYPIFSFFHQSNPILIFSLLNVIWSVISLYLFFLVLEIINPLKEKNIWAMVFVAFGFGFIRYSGENETYILPILFSLLGTYFHFKNANKIWTYLFISIAVLFHQIHIFWLLGFAISDIIQNKNWRPLLISCFAIVLFYIGYAIQYEITWYTLPFYDVQQGQVTTSLGIKNILFTPINFIRTFIQVHGDILLILKIYKVYLYVITGIILLTTIIFYSRFVKLIKSIKTISLKKIKANLRFSNPLILCILFHFLFAFYSEGNAEFMVMLPMLMLIWFSQSNLIINPLLKLLSLFLIVWNSIFFIIPSKQYDFKEIAFITNEIQQLSQSKNTPVKFISNNNVVFSNYIEYANLIAKSNKLKISVQNIDEFNKEPFASSKFILLTDAIENTFVTDRKSIVSKLENQNGLFNQKYQLRTLAILQPNMAQKIKITELY
jgi:hypothetical protein